MADYGFIQTAPPPLKDTDRVDLDGVFVACNAKGATLASIPLCFTWNMKSSADFVEFLLRLCGSGSTARHLSAVKGELNHASMPKRFLLDKSAVLGVSI